MASNPLVDVEKKASYGAVRIHWVINEDVEKGGVEEEDEDVDDNASVGSFADKIVDYIDDYVGTGEIVGVRDFQGDATIPAQIVNLIKNLVGCGVLALPNGVGAFASAPSAVIPAAIYTALMGAVFGYYFLLIGKTCRMVSAASFREAWSSTMGSRGSFAVAAVNMLKPALADLAYSMILADTFKSLFETAGYHLTRTATLWLITVCAILPLCLLKNLSVLSPFSVLGSLGMLLTAVVMGVRYFDGTYDPARNGIFLDDIPRHLQPKFGTVGVRGAWSPQVMVLVCMLFEAYVAHYNAPRFYIELKNRSVERFSTVVSYSFAASGAIYILMTTFGFLTFGVNCDGYVLNNYSINDNLATMSRFAIAFAILFTYPVVFLGFRDGVFDLLPIPSDEETSHLLNVLTVVLLTIITTIATFFDDLGLVNAVGGGTVATAIVFVFPTLMFNAAVHKGPSGPPSAADSREALFALLLMWVGIAMGLTGVWMAIADLHKDGRR